MAKPASSQALPQHVRLVKIGNTYRLVWPLGTGLGHAWYSVTADQLKKLYGTTNPVPHATLSNVGQFEAQYKNSVYWGTADEIELKADTPWASTRQKIQEQFGFVPGFDDPEIQRLLIQAYFEKWDQTEWQVNYRKTKYYNTHTDKQRQWAGYSEAEKTQLINESLTQMKNRWTEIYGVPPNAAQLAGLRNTAVKIASGEVLFEQWDYNQTESAATRPGTPEYARREAAKIQANEPANRRDAAEKLAEDMYREWVGPGALPANFVATWGNRLATGTSSEADLEKYLKTLSQSRWQTKPPDVTWADWSAGYKSEIASVLELGDIDDSDPLLHKVLRSDASGVDLEQLIRSDARFKSTNRMYGELSSLAADMGQRFGFIK